MTIADFYGLLGFPSTTETELPLNAELDRGAAARISHIYLKQVLGEADEVDLPHVRQLADIYDCRVCFTHVAQVYEKGIMEAPNQVFGIRDRLPDEAAVLIIERIRNKSKRVTFPDDKKVAPADRKVETPRFVEQTMISDLIKALNEEHSGIRYSIIDVRNSREYEEEHYPGAVNIPITRIAVCPEGIATDTETILIFICKGGVQSKIAAGYALEAGFTQVYYSAYEEE